ncbi:hypothetical protein ACWPKO_06325 [Coraliomargarita sp. W4R53]
MNTLLLAGVALSSYNATHAESAQTIDLYRIPEATPEILNKIPKNLARWHMGATLVLVKDEQFQRIQVPDVGYFDESIFLSDNSALTYDIERGEHDYIIDLGQFMRVSRFFLNNQSAAGTFEIRASDTLEDLDSRFWVKLTNEIAFEKGVIPSATFPEIETRYILVRFKIDSAGTIGNFGATGPLKITQAEFNLGKGEDESGVIQARSPEIDYDFASSYTGSRIAYVSGGDLDTIYNLIDEDPTTSYAFPADEESIIIVDMRKETQMRTFVANYHSQVSGLVQVYMVDQLPTYFENPEQIDVATYKRADGSVARMELAANGDQFKYMMAAQHPREVVRVPSDYFLSIEDSYQARVSADEDRYVQLFDDLERRYLIFRFIPQALETNTGIQTAVYRPGSTGIMAQRAQSSSPTGISFGQIEVIGEVQFDDLFFTMEAEGGEPGGPPEDPPDDPPVISQ